MHAEIPQLLLNRLGVGALPWILGELAQRLDRLVIQTLNLLQVQPVGAEDFIQTAKRAGQALGAGAGNAGNIQARQKIGQRDTGGKFSRQLARLLGGDTALQQLVDDLSVVRVGEEGMNLVGDFQPHIRQIHQHLGQGTLDALQRAQRARQQLGGFLSHIGNAQGVDETRQGRRPTGLNGRQQILGRQLGKAVQRQHLLIGQAIQVRRGGHQAGINQLLDALFAQAINIHGPTRDEVNDRLFKLRLTGQTADTAVDRAFAGGRARLAALDQLRALHRRAAYRAIARHLHRPRIRRAAFGNHLHHLRDHIPGAADNHGIADHHAQPRDFVHVVQGGIGYRHACDLDRLEPCHWRHRTGATHLKLDVQQLGQLLHGRKLVGNRPARLASTETQLTLVAQLVDLEHYAVDLVFQRGAALADIAVVGQRAVDAFHQFQFTADRHTPALECLQNGVLIIRQLAVDTAEAIAAEFQRTAGSNGRIKLAQATGGGVAGIGEGLATGFTCAFVQRLKAGLTHEHFTTHFQHCRPAFTTKLQRNIANGAYIGGDIFTGGAVPPGGTAHQHAIFVQQTDRQAIQLGLTAIFHLSAAAKQVANWQVQSLAHTPIKVEHVLLSEGIAETQHRHFVLYLAKPGRRRAAHTLGR